MNWFLMRHSFYKFPRHISSIYTFLWHKLIFHLMQTHLDINKNTPWEGFSSKYNSILLHGGLNPAWHFWLSTRFSCCLKMKSVENILGYIWEQFYRFSRGCKPQENIWNCSRKCPKMFKTDSFLGNEKLSLNQSVWPDHATMQQDILLHHWHSSQYIVYYICTHFAKR